MKKIWLIMEIKFQDEQYWSFFCMILEQRIFLSKLIYKIYLILLFYINDNIFFYPIKINLIYIPQNDENNWWK